MKIDARQRALLASIYWTMGCYFVAQLVLFSGFSIAAGFFARYAAVFFAACTIFHIFVLYMLIRFQNDFYLESTKTALSSMNLANKITLGRLSTLPTILFFVIAAKDYELRIPLLILVSLVFLSDFADGYISRKANEVTRIGRMMDSSADYCLLIVLSIVFYYYRLIPRWFFALVMLRLLVQVFLVAIVFFARGELDPRSTFMGKLVVALMMLFYGLMVVDLISGGLPRQFVHAAEYLVAASIIVGIIDKFISFADAMRQQK